MGNKPHRNKKLKMKALRKAAKVDMGLTSEKTKKTNKVIFFLRPFNKMIAKEMLRSFKREVEHIHLKNKPHHHKRTTPGSVDPDIPMMMTGHHIPNKSKKTKHIGEVQKSADLGKKYLRYTWKKAA